MKFMGEQASTMEPELMAERVHEVLIEKCPMAEGIGLDEIREHIMTHTLCPEIRVACMIRSVLRLVERLEPNLTTVEPDTGQLVVDGKNVNAYLKGIAEAMQMYRAGDVNKMLFSRGGKT